jgi:hypothetical protein
LDCPNVPQYRKLDCIYGTLETHRMKKLLEFLLTGCFHEWEIEDKKKVFDFEVTPEDILTGKHFPIGSKYTLRCKKCGELKTYTDY